MVTTTDEHGPRHLLVDAPPGASVADLHATLGLPDQRARVTGVPLRHGYEVDARIGGPPTTCPVRLVVVSGPDAGGSVPIPPGRWVVVGRAASCDLTVLDPTLSRAHLRVRHERSGVVVEDLGSTNGLRWDGTVGRGDELPGAARASSGDDDLRARTAWPPGSTLVVGTTRLALVLEPLPPAAGRDQEGRLRVTPWPRRLPETRPVRLSSPAPPQRREVRVPSPWMWAPALVAAVVVAVVLRMPTVLLFGLMAPTMVLGHHLGERRAARLDHEAAVRQRADAADQLALAAERALAEEREALRARHPGVLGVITSLLPWPTTGLWSRAGAAPTVVLGEGRAPSVVELDGALLEHTDAPVVLDLSQPVAVIGPPRLRAGMVRCWLLQLACAHPPSELTLAVDPAVPPAAEWDLLA